MMRGVVGDGITTAPLRISIACCAARAMGVSSFTTPTFSSTVSRETTS
jgi:hypothetical protein